MSAENYIYPYDPLGVLESNFIRGEAHTLTPSNGPDYQFIIPRVGPFFKRDLIVVHTVSGKVLHPGPDVLLTHRYAEASEILSEDVYSSITFMDKNLAGEVKIYYRALGGELAFDQTKLLANMSSYYHFPTDVRWEDIYNVPATFPPAPHSVDIQDTTGYIDLLRVMQELKISIEGQGEGNHMHDIGQIRNLERTLQGLLTIDGNHKPAPSKDGADVVDLTGSIAIACPAFRVATKLHITVAIIDGDDYYRYHLGGQVNSAYNVVEGDPWMKLYGYCDHPTPVSRKLTATYDKHGHPVLFIGREDTFRNIHAVIENVTIDSSVSEFYNNDWVIYPVAGDFANEDPTFGSPFVTESLAGNVYLIPSSVDSVDPNSVAQASVYYLLGENADQPYAGAEYNVYNMREDTGDAELDADRPIQYLETDQITLYHLPIFRSRPLIVEQNRDREILTAYNFAVNTQHKVIENATRIVSVYYETTDVLQPTTMSLYDSREGLRYELIYVPLGQLPAGVDSELKLNLPLGTIADTVAWGTERLNQGIGKTIAITDKVPVRIADYSQEGDISPNSIWFADTTAQRTRTVLDGIDGQTFAFRDTVGQASTNPILLVGKIEGFDSIKVDTDHGWARFRWSDSVGYWQLVEGIA